VKKSKRGHVFLENLSGQKPTTDTERICSRKTCSQKGAKQPISEFQERGGTICRLCRNAENNARRIAKEKERMF